LGKEVSSKGKNVNARRKRRKRAGRLAGVCREGSGMGWTKRKTSITDYFAEKEEVSERK